MEELDRYPWSGHSVLVGKQKNDWQEVEYVLSYFGKEKSKAIRAYRKFMEEGKEPRETAGVSGGRAYSESRRMVAGIVI